MTGEWGLAFEQDSSLATVSGSAAAVAGAARRGADLRLYMTTETAASWSRKRVVVAQDKERQYSKVC